MNSATLKDARRYATAGVQMLSNAGLEATAETPLPRESDASEIVKTAERWDADIIVLGSHGRRGFDLMTMGSVSEHVTLHAPCSVEAIRTPKAKNTKSKENLEKEERFSLASVGVY